MLFWIISCMERIFLVSFMFYLRIPYDNNAEFVKERISAYVFS
jgi:hypothetical protein